MADITEYVEYLAKEIGPRPAGTVEEQQAAKYISEKFEQDAGLKVAIEDFDSAPEFDNVRLILTVLSFVFVLFSSIWVVLALPSIIVTFFCGLVIFLESRGKVVLSKWAKKGISQNVVAHYDPTEAAGETKQRRRKKIIIVARYDSTRSRPDLAGPLGAVWPMLHQITLWTSVLTPALLLIHFAFFMYATGVAAVVWTILTIADLGILAIYIAAEVLRRRAKYNNAAVFNASGVALLIHLAERINKGDFSPSKPRVHGKQAAAQAGVVPQGATLEYETSSNFEEEFAAALERARKAAVPGYKPEGASVPQESPESSARENITDTEGDSVMDNAGYRDGQFTQFEAQIRQREVAAPKASITATYTPGAKTATLSARQVGSDSAVPAYQAASQVDGIYEKPETTPAAAQNPHRAGEVFVPTPITLTTQPHEQFGNVVLNVPVVVDVTSESTHYADYTFGGSEDFAEAEQAVAQEADPEENVPEWFRRARDKAAARTVGQQTEEVQRSRFANLKIANSPATAGGVAPARTNVPRAAINRGVTGAGAGAGVGVGAGAASRAGFAGRAGIAGGSVRGVQNGVAITGDSRTGAASAIPASAIPTSTIASSVSSTTGSAQVYNAPTYDTLQHEPAISSAPSYSVPDYSTPSYSAPSYSAPSYETPAVPAQNYDPVGYAAPMSATQSVYNQPAYVPGVGAPSTTGGVLFKSANDMVDAMNLAPEPQKMRPTEVILPDFGTKVMAPIDMNDRKQRAPLAQAESEGKEAAAKSLLTLLPSIDLDNAYGTAGADASGGTDAASAAAGTGSFNAAAIPPIADAYSSATPAPSPAPQAKPTAAPQSDRGILGDVPEIFGTKGGERDFAASYNAEAREPLQPAQDDWAAQSAESAWQTREASYMQGADVQQTAWGNVSGAGSKTVVHFSQDEQQPAYAEGDEATMWGADEEWNSRSAWNGQSQPNYGSAGMTGMFAPVGDALRNNATSADDLYVDDADDSAFADGYTATGAYAGTDYVNIPQSRGPFGKIFRKKSGRNKDGYYGSEEWNGGAFSLKGFGFNKKKGEAEEEPSADDFYRPGDGYSEGDDEQFGGELGAAYASEYAGATGMYEEASGDTYEGGYGEGYSESYESGYDESAYRGAYEGEYEGAYADEAADYEDVPQDNWNGEQAYAQDTGEQVYAEDEQVYADEEQNYDETESWEDAYGYPENYAASPVAPLYGDADFGGESRRGHFGGRKARGGAGAVGDYYLGGEVADEDGRTHRSRKSKRSHKQPGIEQFTMPSQYDRVSDIDDIIDFRDAAITSDVYFVALGAEGADNSGIKAFLAEHKDELGGATIIEVDAMGAGQLSMSIKEGKDRTKVPNERLQRHMQRASSLSGAHVELVNNCIENSATFYALQEGLSAMHFSGMQGKKPAYMGQKNDTVDKVNRDTLQTNEDFIMELIRAL